MKSWELAVYGNGDAHKTYIFYKEPNFMYTEHGAVIWTGKTPLHRRAGAGEVDVTIWVTPGCFAELYEVEE